MNTPEPIAHRPTARIMAALEECGWTFVGSKFPGNAMFAHPLSGTEQPTPEYMQGRSSWPFDTYHQLRQISFNYEGRRISALWLWVSRAPWVNVDQGRLTFKAAEAFIREDWKP